MKNKTAFKTIREFLFQENKVFVIPNYQRGYKWAVKYDNKESAVEKLMIDLNKAYKNNDYFLQGVTVSESADNQIILIDGQQRTTTLYLLLWCLNKDIVKNIDLVYDIREQSKEFINGLKTEDFDYMHFDKDEKSQDIYYFKEAINQINSKLNEIDNKSEFYKFLLDNVKILYIIIDIEKATNTFTMMNGSKATMLKEELIKAEMLRKVSLPEMKDMQVSTSVDENIMYLKEIITQDWETNALRSRYAREWDKWLYWWNRKDVRLFFDIENPLGLLISFYLWNNFDRWNKKISKNEHTKFTFDDFRSMLLPNREDFPHTYQICHGSGNISEKSVTKLIFKELRDLQKSFEDIFNKCKIHNFLKMSLICAVGEEDKYNIIRYFIEKKNDDTVDDDYAKWRLVGATHLEIVDPTKSTGKLSKEEKAKNVYELLSQSYVYCDENNMEYKDGRKELAFKQLLRLNVEMDNDLNHYFDFSIWKNRSLEHIFPKSRKDEITFDVGSSVHCIGNLVLLYGSDNSSFGKLDFENKKEKFFNLYIHTKERDNKEIESIINSNKLLHTVSVFSNKQWKDKEIVENQKRFLDKFEKDYDLTK